MWNVAKGNLRGFRQICLESLKHWLGAFAWQGRLLLRFAVYLAILLRVPVAARKEVSNEAVAGLGKIANHDRSSEEVAAGIHSPFAC